ncbi:hypothetical protein ACFY2M_44775 [Streptomyces sp. NPDC001276]|uniref:hypothetical protein n=1 Tax=Streptomyces sp. NPDC001276 TaxID=3364555 RepID=UPI00367469ED
MNQEVEIIEVVDAAVGGERSSRLEQDAARIEELSYKGFEGPAYEAFESELFLELQPIVLGMIGSNKMAQLAQKHSARLGRDFFVHADDVRLLKGSQEARDTLMVEVLAYAMKKFRTDLRKGCGWRADYNGPRGASCVTSYIVLLCIWTFRRAYVRWAREHVKWARLHAVYDFTEDAANQVGIGRLLGATDYRIDTEVFGTALEEILDEQAPATQAVVRLTVMGFGDAEIADKLNLSHGAVRMRKTLFRTALYKAARERRIWIPEQLHTQASVRTKTKRGAA